MMMIMERMGWIEVYVSQAVSDYAGMGNYTENTHLFVNFMSRNANAHKNPQSYPTPDFIT